MANTATLVQSRMMSPSVASLSLAVRGGSLQFRAGQWLNVHLPGSAGPLKRAYSIASAPGDPLLELAVTLVAGGEASPLLHALQPGQQLDFDGPHGLFTRDAAACAAPALFVATGTGLSPFRSMLRARESQSGAAPITLLFGARTQADILWRDELESLSQRDKTFRLEVTLSRPDSRWSGRGGHVQAHLASLARELAAPAVYICGLTRMVAEVRSILKGELGYDRRRIHSERYD